MIEIGTGNLLASVVDALVNTVNCVGIMGKGIALDFKTTFPENYRSYERACRENTIRPGRMHVFDRGALWRVGPRWIINFPTKLHWREPSTLEFVSIGLADLTRVVTLYKIASIAIPPLGCGNGGLDWKKVRPMIVKAFEPLPDVRVLLFEPQAQR